LFNLQKPNGQRRAQMQPQTQRNMRGGRDEMADFLHFAAEL
jgi:hypothetical protein